jgi:nicotinamidase-related amidase
MSHDTDDAPLGRSALIVVDLQVGTTQTPKAHPIEEVVPRVRHLADAFRALGHPVIWATVDGTPAGRTSYSEGGQAFPDGFATLRDDLGAHDQDRYVVRRSWSVLAGDGLDAELRLAGVSRIVIAGVATSFGVESTARQAYDLGYDVVLVADAITDNTIEAHDRSVSNVFPALGRLIPTAELV